MSFVTACGSNGPANESANASATNTEKAAVTPTDAPKDAPAAPKEKKKLKLWYYFEGQDRFNKISVLTDGFAKTKEGEGIEVEPIFTPFAEFKKKLSIGLAADDLPDIVIIDNPDHAAYSAMGLFADITDKIKDWPDKDQYFDGPWKSVVYDGKVYGVPLGSNNLALFYNQALLDKDNVKVPTTWDELKVAAKTLSHDGVTGMAISAPPNEEGTFQFLPWLLSAGASFDKINSPEGIKAYSFLTDLIEDGSMSKEVINWTQGDIQKQFAAGKVAMMANGPWQVPALKSEAPDLKYGVALLPKDKQYASVLGGENLGIVNGKNVDEALAFVKYVSSAEVNKAFAQSFGYFPARKDIASDPFWSEDPINKVFADNMQYAQPRGPHPNWPAISNAISDGLSRALTKNKTAEDAANGAQAAIDKLLE